MAPCTFSSSSSRPLHILLYGQLSLPALPLALLTGFTLSLTIPSALHALFPALHSLFLVSLPQLWHAYLSWFTPPCLFLLLNGIVVILTASSGRFSKPPPPSNLLAKIEKLASHNVVTSSTELSLSTSAPIVPLSIDAMLEPVTNISAVELPVTSFVDIAICYRFLDREEVPMNVICGGEFNDDHNIKEMQILSQEAGVNDNLGDDGSDDPTRSWCEEVLKGGSEPSTPTHSSNPAASKENMRRALSIDSVRYIDDVEESPECKLSEEAFKKRIEDYICKVNAKLRSETRFT